MTLRCCCVLHDVRVWLDGCAGGAGAMSATLYRSPTAL
eukprot:COSAG06_NODE_64586_length_259_cov_0.643750_1_plen_37_part_01